MSEKIITILIGIVIGLTVIFSIESTVRSYNTRRLCNELRNELADAEDTNRRLTETIEQCKSISGELGQSVERNISTARECIELIEEIRAQVYSLEVVTGSFNIDKYYNDTDIMLGLEELNVPK